MLDHDQSHCINPWLFGLYWGFSYWIMSKFIRYVIVNSSYTLWQMQSIQREKHCSKTNLTSACRYCRASNTVTTSALCPLTNRTQVPNYYLVNTFSATGRFEVRTKYLLGPRQRSSTVTSERLIEKIQAFEHHAIQIPKRNTCTVTQCIVERAYIGRKNRVDWMYSVENIENGRTPVSSDVDNKEVLYQ